MLSSVDNQTLRVGISGSGFIARGIAGLIQALPGLYISKVLTRRPVTQSFGAFEENSLTNSVDDLISASDVVIECSGDTVHGTKVLLEAGQAGLPLVTMNSELQATVGSAFVRRGFWITEAHGDQPGCLAELHTEALEMGFEPLAYINLRGFLNETPTREDMIYWSEKQGLSLRQVTSFTDGSKLQIEQLVVANGLGARIAKRGMIGGTVEDLADLDYLARAATDMGEAISDYVLNPGGPPGVLVLAKSQEADRMDGYMPFTRLLTSEKLAYRLLRPHHMAHLEVGKTLYGITRGAPPLLNARSAPIATMATIAKREIAAGTRIDEALGGFDLRCEADELRAGDDRVPITLLDGAVTRHRIEPGQELTFSDVDVEESEALSLYLESTKARDDLQGEHENMQLRA